MLTFVASDDATVRADRPTKSFGSTTTLQADGQPDKGLLLRFVVTGVGGRRVDRATQRLYGTDPSPVGGTLASTTSSSWSETTATWVKAPPANGNPVAASGPDGWALISWNEIAENSHIQPLSRWGDAYLRIVGQLAGRY